MNNVLAVRLAAICGFLAVALGAFGAHGLAPVLARHGTSAIWDTAVLYHAIHAVVVLLLGVRSPLKTGPILCFLVGIAVFSGSLYLLAVTNLRWLGAITPLGGVAFLAGWFWLILKPGVISTP